MMIMTDPKLLPQKGEFYVLVSFENKQLLLMFASMNHR